jgi:hypothetical protein
MITANGDIIRIRWEDRSEGPASGKVVTDDLAVVLASTSRIYRQIRLFQYLEVSGMSARSIADPVLLYIWFRDSDIAIDNLSSSALLSFTEWTGGLYLEEMHAGSWEAAIKAFGQGAGDGIASAVKGVADALVTIITSPAEFRSRMNAARQQEAEAKFAQARTLANEERLETFVWASRVLRGELTVSPQQKHFALEALRVAGQIDQEFVDRMLLRLDQDSESVATLGTSKVLTP